MRDTPCDSKLPAKTWLAASEGWNPSQNTYDVALEHVPMALALQSREVSSVPVPQQALLDSKNPEIPSSHGKLRILINESPLTSGKSNFGGTVYIQRIAIFASYLKH